jgi:hypothetical protein
MGHSMNLGQSGKSVVDIFERRNFGGLWCCGSSVPKSSGTNDLIEMKMKGSTRRWVKGERWRGR